MSHLSRFTFLSQSGAIMGSVISVCGIIFLMGLGAFYHSELEQLVNGAEPIEDPVAVAKACYSAAFIYGGMFLFCFFQDLEDALRL
ncbi:hypothetical protein HDU91_000356 [Kappamyces sp. JEL0680]|nr:hypothetical protein HDU91_000356 [Kappamyces sp. JEL0680]